MALSSELLAVTVIFLFSVVGGITGIGIATIITPTLLFLGLKLNEAKSVSLWVNVWLMTLSVYRRWGDINWHLAIPLVVTSFLFAPLGAKLSLFIPERVQLLLLGTFVIGSAALILHGKIKPKLIGLTYTGYIKIGLFLGTLAGIVGGLLGIGGGILVNPILLILGLDPLLVTSVSAILVLVSSFSGWFAYTKMGFFHWSLALPVALAAILGSFLGNSLAQKFSKEKLREVVAYFALFVGFIIYLKALFLH
jgi:uncharacterized membrane protein YfcA